MKTRAFSHCAITVSDFNRAVRFYTEHFGCTLVAVSESPTERVRTFFGVAGERPTCRIGWLRAPRGAAIEIFEFTPRLPAEAVAWNRVGLTHISFDVRNVHRWHEYLVRKGVEIVSKPEQSPHGQWLFFVKDFDGNLIELMDLGYKYHLLRWLGPLGGWLFRRGMYRQYYQ